MRIQSTPEPHSRAFHRRPHEAFNIISVLAGRHGPLYLIHMDSHADLGTGLGDLAWIDIGSRLLGLDCLHRPAAILREGDARISPANYLAFVIACRWLRSLVYVHYPAGGDDLMPFFFRDFDVAGTVIEMRFIPEGLDAAIEAGSRDRLRQLHIAWSLQFFFKRQPPRNLRPAHRLISLSLSIAWLYSDRDDELPVLSDYIDFETAPM